MFDDDGFTSERLLELERIEEEERQRAVSSALAKFGFFLHVTAFISGESFLLIMGILVPKTLPCVLIPMGLWVLGLAYHAWRTFSPRSHDAAVLKIKNALSRLRRHGTAGAAKP